MLKHTEVRIGNLVNYGGGMGEWGICKISQITPNSSMNGLYGIPLTEEWLLRLGFIAGNFTPKKYELPETLYYGYLYSEFQFHTKHGGFMADLKYVHQLQNLYFALTGKELVLADNADPK